jgi:hypothetical protein
MFWLLLACSTPAPQPLANSISVLYTGNIDGEIEPCG